MLPARWTLKSEFTSLYFAQNNPYKCTHIVVRQHVQDPYQLTHVLAYLGHVFFFSQYLSSRSVTNKSNANIPLCTPSHIFL